MKRFKLAVVLVMVVVFAAGVAWAGAFKDVKAAGKLIVKKQYDQAIAKLDCAMISGKLDESGLAVAYFYRGLAYLKKNCCQMAVADFSQAINLLPRYGAAYYYRSEAYKCLGCTEQAEADMAAFEELKAKFGLAGGPGKYLDGQGKPVPVCVPCCPCGAPPCPPCKVKK
jgi:tetratricopeptide (TPR) repeat protein